MRDDDTIDRLSARMAELQHELLARDRSARHDRMRAAVLAGVHGPGASQRGASSTRTWAIAWASAAMAVLVVLAWSALRPTPLTFRIDAAGGQVEAESLVVADGDEPLTLTFSDGSAVVLDRGSRVRVGTRRVDGVDLVLEAGRLETRLQPHGAAAWRIVAGPYEVVVVGEAVVLEWTPQITSFELEPQRGRVEVRGPGIEGTRVLDAGERLVIAGEPREGLHAATGASTPTTVAPPSIDAVAPTPVVEATPPSQPAAPERVAAVGRRGARAKPPPATASEAASWRSLAHERRWSDALRLAETVGFASLCDTLEASALLELADVGRYAGARARAREALLALRRRFAGSEAAAAAAFDLGRLERDCEGARPWFRSYLRERPDGAMATAARQRLAQCEDDRSDEPTP